MKARRQGLILELIDQESVPSQEALRKRLRQKGFEATQATISRDIRDLGLVKRSGDGGYQRAGAEVGWTASSSSWCCAPARVRRSRWLWPSTVRSFQKRSAPLPATIRSCWWPAMSGVPRRSSSGSNTMQACRREP